ncbi:MAG: hypothetical protein P9X22_08770 [Candidatus Zapsychrus exili]|nr:hypothetical protein [Candidatus Zapsychrus exili]
MVEFNLWSESFIFSAMFSVIIIIPCIIIAALGKRTIESMGRYPSKTPTIQMGILIQLVVVEIITFLSLTVFYIFF